MSSGRWDQHPSGRKASTWRVPWAVSPVWSLLCFSLTEQLPTLSPRILLATEALYGNELSGWMRPSDSVTPQNAEPRFIGEGSMCH